jgi:GAF domain-containing protein
MVTCELTLPRAGPELVVGWPAAPSLRALKTLFDSDPDLESPEAVLQPLAEILLFDHALVLRDNDDHWGCAAASARELTRLRWAPGAFFDQIAAGRICARRDSHELPEWSAIPRATLDPAGSTLYMPLRVRGNRGLLILLRLAGDGAFGDADIAMARQVSVLAMATLAARSVQGMQTELRQMEARWTGCARTNRTWLVAHTPMS